VQAYLKIDTDERGTCRVIENGKCTESGEIFSLEEQRNTIIDHDPIAKIVEVKAGRVEIVGDKRVAPVRLIAILQQNGIINPTEPERTAMLNSLLERLYGETN